MLCCVDNSDDAAERQSPPSVLCCSHIALSCEDKKLLHTVTSAGLCLCPRPTPTLSVPPLPKAPVRLNVYHLIDEKTNLRLCKLGFGIFHTGVIVYGIEWSFGESSEGQETGLFCVLPGNAAGVVYKTLDLGYTEYSPEQVDTLLHRLENEWKSADYHVLHNNCNHFTERFVSMLSSPSQPLAFPAWCNRSANFGDKLIPQRFATWVLRRLDEQPPAASTKCCKSANMRELPPSVIPNHWYRSSIVGASYLHQNSRNPSLRRFSIKPPSSRGPTLSAHASSYEGSTAGTAPGPMSPPPKREPPRYLSGGHATTNNGTTGAASSGATSASTATTTGHRAAGAERTAATPPVATTSDQEAFDSIFDPTYTASVGSPGSIALSSRTQANATSTVGVVESNKSDEVVHRAATPSPPLLAESMPSAALRVDADDPCDDMHLQPLECSNRLASEPVKHSSRSSLTLSCHQAGLTEGAAAGSGGEGVSMASSSTYSTPEGRHSNSQPSCTSIAVVAPAAATAMNAAGSPTVATPPCEIHDADVSAAVDATALTLLHADIDIGVVDENDYDDPLASLAFSTEIGLDLHRHADIDADAVVQALQGGEEGVGGEGCVPHHEDPEVPYHLSCRHAGSPETTSVFSDDVEDSIAATKAAAACGFRHNRGRADDHLRRSPLMVLDSHLHEAAPFSVPIAGGSATPLDPPAERDGAVAAFPRRHLLHLVTSQRSAAETFEGHDSLTHEYPTEVAPTSHAATAASHNAARHHGEGPQSPNSTFSTLSGSPLTSMMDAAETTATAAYGRTEDATVITDAAQYQPAPFFIRR